MPNKSKKEPPLNPNDQGLEPAKGQFLVYQAEDGKLKLDVRFEDESVWLTQQLMADLFQTTRQNISLHVQNIYEEIYPEIKTYTRAVTLGSYTNFVEDIYESVVKKLDEFDLVKMKVRLLGVKISNLSFGPAPLDLFSGTTDKENRKERIHKAIDHMIDKFGAGAIRRRC